MHRRLRRSRTAKNGSNPSVGNQTLLGSGFPAGKRKMSGGTSFGRAYKRRNWLQVQFLTRVNILAWILPVPRIPRLFQSAQHLPSLIALHYRLSVRLVEIPTLPAMLSNRLLKKPSENQPKKLARTRYKTLFDVSYVTLSEKQSKTSFAKLSVKPFKMLSTRPS